MSDKAVLILTKKYKKAWKYFLVSLANELENIDCDHKSFELTVKILKTKFHNYNIDKSIEYYKKHFGSCDCKLKNNFKGYIKKLYSSK